MARPSLLMDLIGMAPGGPPPSSLSIEPSDRSGASAAAASMMAHALQGQPMGRALFADLGTALAGFHQVAVPPSWEGGAATAEAVSTQPLLEALQADWAVWLTDDCAALPPLPSPAQEAMRQRFLSRHGKTLQVSARQMMEALQPSPANTGSVVLSHGALALDAIQILPDGRFVAADSPVAGVLPGWWDVGFVLAWLPLLAHVHYSAVHYEPIVLTAYLKAVPPAAVEPQYSFVRTALQVAGLSMAALVLSPDRLPWLKDVYLKETFLKQAVTLVESPSQVDWLVQLPQ
jgi:hypothetical protein